MIKMIRGVFGLPVNGIVKAVDKNYGPFEAGAEQEARLIRLGLAVRVEEGEPATVDTDAPIGFDETPPEDFTEDGDELPELPDGVIGIPEYNEDMKASELREIGAMCGLTFKVGMSKKDMVAALDAHIEANMVDDEDEDGEPAPEFDAAEAVL